jgi:Tfp pilus assembly protein PilE
MTRIEVMMVVIIASICCQVVGATVWKNCYGRGLVWFIELQKRI